MERKNFLKNSFILKGAAAAVAVALVAAASLIPAKSEPASFSGSNALTPDPVVMELVEEADAVLEEETSEEEEKKQKLGFFTKLKLAFYTFCAASGAWMAHKIPWKKIFNKRNAILVLVLAAAILLVYYVGLPMLENRA